MQKMWCVLAFAIESDSDSSAAGLDPDENDVSERSSYQCLFRKHCFVVSMRSAKKKLKSV